MFSQTADYALRAMIHLAARRGAPTTSEIIAAATRVPAGYLSKILRGLVVARLVRSQRGPNGGFTLSRSAADITILDIVNAVDPLRRIEGCPMSDPALPRSAHHPRLCALHSRLDSALERVETELRTTTLAAIMDDQAGPGRCAGPGAIPARPEFIPKPTLNGMPPAA